MHPMKRLLPLVVMFATFIGPVAADEAERQALAERLEGVSAENLTPSPVAGLYELRVGTSVAYVSADGRYLLRGQMIDLATHANLTEATRSGIRAELIDGFDESTMIVFEPEGEVLHTLTVFTDTECGFCRRFHAEIDQVLDQGIRVRYLLHPALGETSVEQAGAVWCSGNRQAALTQAKAGTRVRSRDCDDVPIDEHMRLARDIGVRGTPWMITEAGGYIRGYIEPDRLMAEIARLSQVANAR
jgi:thiol:disulfide interchange protein DsbC